MDDPVTLAKTLLRPVAGPVESLELVPRTTGRSGASTHEVVLGRQRFLMKTDAKERTLARWRTSLRIQRLAAERGVAPAVRSWDESTRTVLTDHVSAISLPTALVDARRRELVLRALAQSVATLHGIDPGGAEQHTQHTSPMQQSREVLERVAKHFEVPEFASRAWLDLLGRATAPAHDTLCHQDLNPSNLLFDGHRVWLVDWDTAGPGDRWFDVATVANLLLFDPEQTERWVRQYVEAAGVSPPTAERLNQARRTSYVGYGCAFLGLVERPVALPAGSEPSLARCYAELQAGQLDLNDDLGRTCLSAACFAAYWDIA